MNNSNIINNKSSQDNDESSKNSDSQSDQDPKTSQLVIEENKNLNIEILPENTNKHDLSFTFDMNTQQNQKQTAAQQRKG